MFGYIAALVAALFLAFQPARAAEPTVEQAWARGSIGPAKSGSAYMTLHGAGEGDRLLGASSPAAARVELHTNIEDGGVMKMRPVESIELAPGESITLKPGGIHLMLFGLAAPLEEGARFPMTLNFEKAGAFDVEIEVLAPTAMGPEHMDHGQMGHGHDGHGHQDHGHQDHGHQDHGHGTDKKSE